MKITPLEIRKHEFASAFRGFDKNEVTSFMENLAAELEQLLEENRDLKDKLKAAQEKLDSYAKIETVLQSTLVTTQETAEQIKAAAQEKADLMVRRAETEADRIIQEAYERVGELRRECSTLSSQKASFLVSFRSLLESELKLLELMEKQSQREDKTIVLKRKPELSDDEVEKLTEEFARETSNRIRSANLASGEKAPGAQPGS